MQLCTATRLKLNQLCTRTAKTHAIPSLHRDNFKAKVQGFCPVLRQVTLTNYPAGPLAGIPHTDFAQLNSQANSTKIVFENDRQFCNICCIFCAVSKDYRYSMRHDLKHIQLDCINEKLLSINGHDPRPLITRNPYVSGWIFI